MFGNNESVVTCGAIPHWTLGKHWNTLSHHHVHEAVAGVWLHFQHILGTKNPANILTMSLPWLSLKIFVKPLLPWKGDTVDAPLGTSPPAGSDVGLRYFRDRISVPRDMSIYAAKRLRQALEETAAMVGDRQGPPIPFQHRRDQDPANFINAS